MEENNELKEWTLMFFFASDNSLSPSMLSQLKSIKAAGSQPDTNVVVHFDSHERGVPSMIFEINKNEKTVPPSPSRIGDGNDPIILNLAGDQVEPKITEEKPNSHTRYSADYDKRNAQKALKHFLKVCRKKYPAKHYMLFLVGHGLVVARDAFLPDENPDSGISMVKLGKILKKFNEKIRPTGGLLELIGMHSCSMSAVEVVYELKGQANFMIASEGLSFVGSWPHRQMLQKIFATIDSEGKEVAVSDLVKKLYELCVHNSADFIFAGYSSDLCLCGLYPSRVENLNVPILELAQILEQALKDARGNELIQLAHLNSQSYFQEVYTDLYDFCEYLSECCRKSGSINIVQHAMMQACEKVINVLKPGDTSVGPIFQADFFGPDVQYSHGLSIYFPWTRPIEDAGEHVIKNYQSSAFVREPAGTAWFKFLEAYFEDTQRSLRNVEYAPNPDYNRDDAQKLADYTFRSIGFGSGQPEYISGMMTGKVNPSDAGGYWSASAIKNYPRKFRISELALKAFAMERGQERNRNEPSCSAANNSSTGS